MAASKKIKVVLLKGCVVAGKNEPAFKEVTLDASDAHYLIVCNTAANPKTEEGKEAIEEAKELAAAAKKAAAKTKRKRTTKKSPSSNPNPNDQGGNE